MTQEYLARWGRQFAGWFKKRTAATASAIGRFFYTRPALKRGALALGLQQLVLVPLGLLANAADPGLMDVWAALIGLQWSVFLIGLFWGMGAERAATDWDSVFALPPLRSFDFWCWHALEKKRFSAVLVALCSGLFLAAFMGAL